MLYGFISSVCTEDRMTTWVRGGKDEGHGTRIIVLSIAASLPGGYVVGGIGLFVGLSVSLHHFSINSTSHMVEWAKDTHKKDVAHCTVTIVLTSRVVDCSAIGISNVSHETLTDPSHH